MNFKTFLIETFFQLRSLERKLLFLTMINKIDILNIIKKTVHRIVFATKKKKNNKTTTTETFRHGPKVELYFVIACEFKKTKTRIIIQKQVKLQIEN